MKSQIISMDMVLSLTLLLLFVLAGAGLLLTPKPAKEDIPTEYIFDNLEANLEEDYPGMMQNYRIDYAKYESFSDTMWDRNIDEYAVGRVGARQGIGLSPDSIDAALYITDTDGQMLGISGKKAIGLMAGSPADSIEPNSYCQGFSETIALQKPYLLDFGDISKNRVIMLHTVICKK